VAVVLVAGIPAGYWIVGLVAAVLLFLYRLAVLFTASVIDKRNGDLPGLAEVLKAIRPRRRTKGP
jgi:hypothetical protein